MIFRGIINSNGDFLQLVVNGAEKTMTLNRKTGDSEEEIITSVKQIKQANVSGIAYYIDR